jgi:hypothetical protein
MYEGENYGPHCFSESEFTVSYEKSFVKQLDQKFIPNNIEELSLRDLQRKQRYAEIVPGRTYFITDSGIYVMGTGICSVSDDA